MIEPRHNVIRPYPLLRLENIPQFSWVSEVFTTSDLDVEIGSHKPVPITKSATIFVLTVVPIPSLVNILVNFQGLSDISEYAWYDTKGVKDFPKKTVEKRYNRFGQKDCFCPCCGLG